MNFNFGEVLARAWQIVWKRRALWIFGILASCSRGGTNVSWSLNGSSGSGGFNGGTSNLPPQVDQLLQFMVQNAVSIVAISIVVVCIIWIVVLCLGTIGRIGLIRGTWQSESGEEASFGQLFSESLPYFWRVFGLSILVGLPFLFVIGGLVAGMLALVFGAALSQGNNASVFGFLAFLPFLLLCICVLIPIGFVVNLIIRQAERVIVLENEGVLPGLSRGWEIFRRNLGPLLLMEIILAVIGFAVGFMVAIPLIIVLVPATFAFMAGNLIANGPNWNAMAFALACTCLLAPVMWLVSGILAAYTESAWTLTYLRITRPPENPPAVIEANA